jgi:CheY-like chemotaxis protein
VRSIAGKGTGFFIEVPLGRSGVNVPEAASLVRPCNGAFLGSVLAIEDEASLRSALQRSLKARGIDATVIATASEALTLIKEQGLRPDVLLCDYNLRGSSDGIETIKSLRVALGFNIPAVVMTGDIRSQTMNLISAQGLTALIKPFSADELLDALRGQEKLVITARTSSHSVAGLHRY